ncbi:hypothetical protein [Enterococcus faecium]|uniref:hypothetical protein n=1 Tax=Enterococcus faecium TaxID=1352 RepID=UPI000B634737|nr:hypothetical protein [Enterococcus faecium]OTO50585.1 hypothetical protein A5814_002753 [Enterococcus faecium]
MDKEAYERKERAILRVPYTERYHALKKEKEQLKEIEISTPECYQHKLKKRMQPNQCFVESIKFARDCREAIYCIGQFQRSDFLHAWIEFEDQDYCFDGTLQAFYLKEKYYKWNGNSFFDKFYKVQNFFPYAIPIVLDNEPPRM